MPTKRENEFAARGAVLEEGLAEIHAAVWKEPGATLAAGPKAHRGRNGEPKIRPEWGPSRQIMAEFWNWLDKLSPAIRVLSVADRLWVGLIGSAVWRAVQCVP